MHWRNLNVWQKAHKLVLETYQLVSYFPENEQFALVSQLKRAAYSIPANLVEGQSRNTTRDYLKFLYNSRGSLEELRYFFLLSKDLLFVDINTYQKVESQAEEISKMLNSLITALKTK